MKILLITQMPPYPANMGGNQRTNLVQRALLRHGQVDLMLTQDPAWLPESHLNVLREQFSMVACVAPTPRGAVGVWRHIRFLRPALMDRLAHHLGSRRVDFRPDPRLSVELRQLESRGPYDLLVGLGIPAFFKTGFSTDRPHVVDLIDLDTDYYRSRLNDPGRSAVERFFLRRHLGQLEAILPRLLASSRHIWVANPNDRRFSWLSHAQTLPNIPFVEPGLDRLEPLPPSDRPVLFFVGSFYHPPNIEGMRRFLPRVWAHVKKVCPEAEMHIYGVGIEGSLREEFLRFDGVKLVDPASPLKNAYADCAFAVAPIYSGAGTCFKVVEALSRGRTLVLSRYAMRGYEQAVVHNQTAWVCDSDAEFIEGCTQLLKDPVRRNQLACEGIQKVAEEFSFGRFQKTIDDTLNNLFPTKW